MNIWSKSTMNFKKKWFHFLMIIQKKILILKCRIFNKLGYAILDVITNKEKNLKFNFNLEKHFVNDLRTFLAIYLGSEEASLVPLLKRRDRPVINTWEHQNENLNWDFEPSAKILDIGSGGNPFSKATHLADKYTGTTTHRVEELARDHRPFYEVDIERLPFGDNEFEFIFCSHVLEHLDNPGLAMREMIRVGNSGYIEVPTRLSDIIFNFTWLENHHKWHACILDNTVILVEWTEAERIKYNHNFFNAIHSQYENSMQKFFEENRSTFFQSLEWKDAFDFIVIDKEGVIIDSSKNY